MKNALDNWDTQFVSDGAEDIDTLVHREPKDTSERDVFFLNVAEESLRKL